MMGKLFLIFILLLVFGSLLNSVLDKGTPPYNDGSVELADKKIFIELADDLDEQINGLSNRESISSDVGMLFVYKDLRKPGFWMKNMNFPIDIIWIKDDLVIDVSENIQPEPGVSDENLRHYSPSEDINKVLEVKALWVKKEGLKIGDKVLIELD